MLAARDQENLVYTHQTKAAGKPLNQGLPGLHSKTPGQRAAKTPFKPSVNNENGHLGGPRTGFKVPGKEDENRVEVNQKGGKGDRDAFVTPLAPRNRAPLGAKTTNAKARAVQTPAPLQRTAKPEKTLKKASTTRKSIKSKIHVAVAEPVAADVLSKDDDSDVAEIEYCPPCPVDLADPPEDITYDDKFPYLRGDNLCGGYGDVYDIPRDEHGVSLRERKEEEAYAKIVQGYEDQFRKEMTDYWPPEGLDGVVDGGQKKHLAEKRNMGTVRAREAVSALSSQPASGLPSVAMKQTASSMQKQKNSQPFLRKKEIAAQPTNPSSMRHTAAMAASKQTIGYSKGRTVSSVLPARTAQASRMQSLQVDQDPQSRVLPFPCPEPSSGGRMWDRIKDDLFGDEAGEDGDGMGRSGPSVDASAADDDGDGEEIVEVPMLGERTLAAH